MATNYKPYYAFYDSLHRYNVDAPNLTCYEDNTENLITSASFRLKNTGGCLEGSINCLYELTTLVKRGWYLKVKLFNGGDTIYSGRITAIKHDFGKSGATIETFGFIRYYKAYTKQEQLIAGIPAYHAIADLAEYTRREIEDYFKVNSVISGATAEDREFYPIWDTIPENTSTRGAFDTLAAKADNTIYYGFFHEGQSPVDDLDNNTITGTDFVVIEGKPLYKGRKFSINQEANLKSYDNNENEQVNKITLYGSNPQYVWTIEQAGSIQENGINERWLQNPTLEDNKQAQEILSAMLNIASTTREQWVITLTHSNITGDNLNFIESGMIYPWNERIMLLDEGYSKLTEAPIREVVINMSGTLNLEVKLGDPVFDFDDEIERLFNVETVADKPFTPKVFISDSLRKNQTEQGPSSIQEPPIGYYVPQRIYSGISFPQVEANKYRLTEYTTQNDGDGTSNFTSETITKYLPYYEYLRLIGFANVGSPYYFALDRSEKQLVNYYATDGSRNKANIGSNWKSWSYKNWYGDRSRKVFFQSNYRKMHLGNNALYAAFDRDNYENNLPFLTHVNSVSNWIMYQAVPLSLILHLGGSTDGSLTAASNIGFNVFDYLMYQYSGADNIYNVIVNRYPYALTYSTTPTDDYITADYASRAFYMTTGGAARAAALGFIYEPVIVLSSSNPLIETGNDSTTKKSQWDIIDNLINEEFKQYILGDFIPNSSLTASLVYQKRNISAITRIDDNGYLNPDSTQTTVSQSYGLPDLKGLSEWRVNGYDNSNFNS